MTNRHYYKARLVKGGVYVPVVTWLGNPIIFGEELERHHRWNALVGSEESSRQILYGEPMPVEIEGCALRNISAIDQAEYEYMRTHAEWARGQADHAEADPKARIDWLSTKLPL